MRNYHYAKEGEVMYHTGLTKEQLAGAHYAVVPGDPGRVPGLAKALDPSAVFLTSHRDYTSWLARVSGEPVLVMSTGMGGPCMSFAVEELARLGVTTFLRAGTTGSIQEGLELGDLVIGYDGDTGAHESGGKPQGAVSGRHLRLDGFLLAGAGAL